MPTKTANYLWIFGTLSCLAGTARAEAPLSAIDWLSKSLVTPAVQALPRVTEPPVGRVGAAVPDSVTTSVLGQVGLDAVGILPPQVTGLPRALWGTGRTTDIEALLATEAPQELPALQGLLMTVLLAEADPPGDSTGESLLLARVDKLLAMGALDQARALLDAAGATASPAIFRRYFDVALLIGDEDRACTYLASAPTLSPALPTRIFCLARAGDFEAAGLTLDTARTLGSVSPADAALLTRFMNPDLDETDTILAAPDPVTPLTLRLFEAIGEPLPVAPLPVAFSYSDLSDRAGWKAQIEAAERLSRAGALSPNLLLGLYTSQRPAASGGVWDRVAAFQKLDAAITAKDVRATEQALPLAWSEMTKAELEVPLAALYADKLARMSLTGAAAQIVFQISLLSSDYESLSAARAATSPTDQFLSAVAKGNLTDVASTDPLSAAIQTAFNAPVIPAKISPLLEQGRIGEVILLALARIEQGTGGDLRGVTEGLSVLRHIGLEDAARRTALELILLDRRG
ncbi:MAG: hypothetical protein WCS20_06100 [Alphaproteobacteria bacterium]